MICLLIILLPIVTAVAIGMRDLSRLLIRDVDAGGGGLRELHVPARAASAPAVEVGVAGISSSFNRDRIGTP